LTNIIYTHPANLFFWPDRTGGSPDQPRGEYNDTNPGGDWKTQNPIISKKRRLTDEKARLEEARDELDTAIP
jgi:hypothetical protein